MKTEESGSSSQLLPDSTQTLQYVSNEQQGNFTSIRNYMEISNTCIKNYLCKEFLLSDLLQCTLCSNHMCYVHTHTHWSFFHACTHFIPVWSRAVVPLYEDLNQLTVPTLGSHYHWSVTLATHKKTKWTFLPKHRYCCLAARQSMLQLDHWNKMLGKGSLSPTVTIWCYGYTRMTSLAPGHCITWLQH